MSLSPQERLTLELAVKKLEQKLVEDSLTGDGLEVSKQEAQKEDNIYNREWLKHHTWILNYEKEIEGLSGEHIAAPFAIQDLEEHVENRGRLYQGTVSSDPRNIPEMLGAGLSPTRKFPNEIDSMHPNFYALLDFLVNGLGSTSSSTVASSGYSAGDSTLVCSSSLGANSWYLCANDVLLEIGSVIATPSGGSCSNPAHTTQSSCVSPETWETIDASWSGTIISRLGDNSMSGGSACGGWSGYSNSERTNKASSSTTQRLMNALVAQLNEYIDAWLLALNKTKVSAVNNSAPNMIEADRQTSIEDHAYLTNYRSTTPLQDGDPGIDGLSGLMGSRQSFIVSRPGRARTAKGDYYPQRINYTKMRSNIQGGTLTRIRYFESFLLDFPSGGSMEEQKRLQEMKALLAD